jgi:aminopeptidase-like protein
VSRRMSEVPAPSMMEILERLVPLNRVMCSSDYDRTIAYLADIAPFREIRYEAGTVHNGWVIPPKWDVVEASISRGGRVVYDGTWHPMAVIALSTPFRGTVAREELLAHLHHDHRFDDAIPFHFRQSFRSWERTWGFCVPRRLVESLPEGDYDVVIETSEAPGYLSMLEWEIPGRLDETVVFGTNLDHPGVANDGLSGVVVGIELFRRLASRPRNLSYRLVLPQGIMGTEYYLGLQEPARRGRILEGVMLEMLGSPTPLALQRSRGGASNLDHAVGEALLASGTAHRTGAFEEIILNDEYLWEAYGIPMSSLSRFPYPEYHTDRDGVGLMSVARLEEAVAVLEAAVDLVEATPLVFKRFEGNVCLSNPRYDLYVDPGQVAFGDAPDEGRRRMRLLMDTIPTLRRPVSVRRLAAEVGLPEDAVLAYLERWASKGLIALRP